MLLSKQLKRACDILSHSSLRANLIFCFVPEEIFFKHYIWQMHHRRAVRDWLTGNIQNVWCPGYYPLLICWASHLSDMGGNLHQWTGSLVQLHNEKPDVIQQNLGVIPLRCYCASVKDVKRFFSIVHDTCTQNYTSAIAISFLDILLMAILNTGSRAASVG